MLDERLARHLHVESLRHRDLHAEHEPHVLFQASTIAALLEGAFDGDVTFEELAEHGDLGLGTLNALDGEMIALDGSFYRADVDGLVEPVAPEERTPFAAVTWFEPSLEHRIAGPLAYDELLDQLDQVAADPEASCALRLDGEFELVRARSVPRQLPPYRPLVEVVADQHVFELGPASRGPSSASASPTTPVGSRPRATTCTSSIRTASAAATCSTAARSRSSPSSTFPGSSTSSYLRASSSTRPTSTRPPPPPWRRWSISRVRLSARR